MDAAIAILVIAITLGVAYVSCVKSENADLKGYLEFYKRQLKATLVSLERGNVCLQEAIDEYKDLSEHYHELCVAYERAYAILEENDLLPGEAE